MGKNFKYEEELKTIKYYIGLYPNSPKYKVSAITGISLDIIRELIEQGYLTEAEGELKTAIKGSISNDERRKLINRLAVDIENDRNKLLEQRQESKLVRDLNDIKNKCINKVNYER